MVVRLTTRHSKTFAYRQYSGLKPGSPLRGDAGDGIRPHCNL